MRSKRSYLVVLAVVLVAALAAPAGAQSREVYWREWDVVIDNVDPEANRFDVAEIYNIDFNGTFRFGQASIPLDRLDSISDVHVFQDGRPLQPGCSQQPGTFCAVTANGELNITYFFFAPITNDDANFRIEYTVTGALRVYEGGDQLWWSVIPPEHYGFPIGSSTVTVELPPALAPREGIDPVVTYGAPTNVDVQGSTITATTTREVGGNETLEIRVQYPHVAGARPAAWQAAFDTERAYEENVQPIINLGVVALALVIGLGGPLLIYARYAARGRDPQVGPVPEYLTSPPSDLPPAVVGTLVDERSDLRDVMSTILDLARRGYLVIEEEQTEGIFGFGKSSQFTFKRTDKDWSGLREFERRMMDNIFSGERMERTLDSLKNKFYTVIEKVQNDLYDELVSEGFFTTAPNATRRNWTGLGILVIGLAVVPVFIGGMRAVETLSPMLMCLPLALGVTGIIAIIAGQYMPAKTRKGAEEAAKWLAFYEYLRNLEKYDNLEAASAHFEDYLPYATAFGLDRSWMRKFSTVETVPVPPWYYPTYMGGPYGRGYIPGTPIGRAYGPSMGRGDFGGAAGMPGEGDLARAGGGFSMETLSQNMALSMENLSSGLSSMMESATRAMTSRPQSSGSSGRWSSGGRSFSGGGFSGGGFSGGGSRGFG